MVLFVVKKSGLITLIDEKKTQFSIISFMRSVEYYIYQ